MLTTYGEFPSAIVVEDSKGRRVDATFLTSGSKIQPSGASTTANVKFVVDYEYIE
jgi:hypothetical protein